MYCFLYVKIKKNDWFHILWFQTATEHNIDPPMLWRRESAVLGRLPERVGGRELCRETGKLPPSLFCLPTGYSLVPSPPRLLGRYSLHSDIDISFYHTSNQINSICMEPHYIKVISGHLLCREGLGHSLIKPAIPAIRANTKAIVARKNCLLHIIKPFS